MVVWSLAPEANGKLRGMQTATVRTDECGHRGVVQRTTLVATRIGDVPPDVTVADPANNRTPRPGSFISTHPVRGYVSLSFNFFTTQFDANPLSTSTAGTTIQYQPYPFSLGSDSPRTSAPPHNTHTSPITISGIPSTFQYFLGLCSRSLSSAFVVMTLHPFVNWSVLQTSMPKVRPAVKRFRFV